MANNGWILLPTKVEDDENIAGLEPLASDKVPIEDFFDVLGPQERKCHLCSVTIKLSPKSKWNLKQHFIHKHPTEWATRVDTSSRKINPKVTKAFQSIAATDDGFEISDFNPDPKRAKFVSGAMNPAAGLDAAGVVNDDRLDICTKNCLTKNEFIIFGNFIATEMQNMKTAEYRRKLKQAIQKCMLEVVAAEDDMLAARDQFDENQNVKCE